MLGMKQQIVSVGDVVTWCFQRQLSIGLSVTTRSMPTIEERIGSASCFASGSIQLGQTGLTPETPSWELERPLAESLTLVAPSSGIFFFRFRKSLEKYHVSCATESRNRRNTDCQSHIEVRSVHSHSTYSPHWK